jgi:CBS domain containing-hemolysin-like protein
LSALVVGLGLLLAAFGATAAVAIAAASRLELTRWVARRLAGADTAATLLSRPGDLASVANALVAVGVTMAGVAAPWALRESGRLTTLTLELVVLVPLVALVTYFLPRALGRRWPEDLVRVAVPRLRPAAGVVGRIVRGRAATERAELEALFRDSTSAGLAREDELEIVTGVMAFADRVLREVMTPRTRAVAAAEDAGTAELAELVASSGYTRIPLYRGSLDEVVGMAHAFDLIKAGREGKVRVRPIAALPATRRCADALLDLRREGRHLAVVVDEFGGTAGLVTLEDLLEELVGEIFDELDEGPVAAPTAPGVLVVDGAAPLAQLAGHFAVDLSSPPKVETAGGYVAWLAGRIPQPGERLISHGLEFDVVEATTARVVRLMIRRSDRAAPRGGRGSAGGA